MDLVHLMQVGMVWAGWDLEDHPVPIPLPWAGTPSTIPHSSVPHPAWFWTLSGDGAAKASLSNLC